MKLFIASDLHGSYNAAEKILQNFRKEGAEHLFLLGDIYNHGPRNGLPESYDPMKVAELLNGIKEKLTVIKGNCDSEVDEMISEFDFLDGACLFVDGKRIFLTHGHVYDKNRLPKNADVLIYGHVHTGFIEEKNGITVANPGSVTFPKNGTPKSYLIIENGILTLKDENGAVIAEKKL